MLQLRKDSQWKYVAFSLASFAACFIFYYISQSVLREQTAGNIFTTTRRYLTVYSIFIDNSEIYV